MPSWISAATHQGGLSNKHRGDRCVSWSSNCGKMLHNECCETIHALRYSELLCAAEESGTAAEKEVVSAAEAVMKNIDKLFDGIEMPVSTAWL